MKLAKPITITINTAENAVRVMMRLSIEFGSCSHSNYARLLTTQVTGEVFYQLEAALKEQGIDWNTWLPPQPFKIADRECEFKADGTVALSCGTVISNAEIEDFLKRREEAAVKEWPKYWISKSGIVYRATSENHSGDLFEKGSWLLTGGSKLVDFVDVHRDHYKSITRAEAVEAVGAANIDQ